MKTQEYNSEITQERLFEENQKKTKCYFCNEIIKREGKTITVQESPKDKDGIQVPVCQVCFVNMTQ